MKHIRPEKMSRTVRLLYETGEIYGLSPRILAPYLGVGFVSIYNWFSGRKPLPAHEALILDGLKRIKEALGEPELEKGVAVRRHAVWIPDLGDDPEAVKEKQFHDQTRSMFYELQERLSPQEHEVVFRDPEVWANFAEVFYLMWKHNVKLPKF